MLIALQVSNGNWGYKRIHYMVMKVTLLPNAEVIILNLLIEIINDAKWDDDNMPLGKV